MTKLSSLSVFFPCFNEEKNIPLFVAEALKVLPSISRKFEIIIVNDGSGDNTLQVAQRLAKKHPEIVVVNHEKNRGYGASLRSGFSAAKFNWIFFTDGDLQFRLDQLKEFIPHTEKSKAIIGYRKHRADGTLRATNARLYKTFVDLLFRVHVKDIDCAFKLFSKDVMEKISLDSDGAFISSEILYKLKKKRVKFTQLPVDHYPRQFGSPSGNSLKVILKAFKEPLRLYLHMKFGLFPSL